MTLQIAKSPKICQFFNLYNSSLGRQVRAALGKSLLTKNSSIFYHKTKNFFEVKILYKYLVFSCFDEGKIFKGLIISLKV